MYDDMEQYYVVKCFFHKYIYEEFDLLTLLRRVRNGRLLSAEAFPRHSAAEKVYFSNLQLEPRSVWAPSVLEGK